jgi:hypothetical protein
MTFFTDSPFERMMVQKPRHGREETPPPLPKDHRCYGCSYYGSGCAGTCYRDLIITQNDKTAER